MSTDMLEPLNPWMAWLIGTSLHASLLVGLVLLVQLTVGRFISPRWRYALWLIVVCRLIMPVVPSSPLSILNLTDLHQSTQATAQWPPGDDLSGTAISLSDVTPLATELPVPSGVARAELAHTASWSVAQIVFWLWLMGAVVYIAWVAWVSFRLLSRVRAGGVATDPAYQAIVDSCRQELQCRTRLRVTLTDAVNGPAVIGLLRPRLLMPPHLPSSLSAQELRYVVLHELAHLKRGDLIVNWLLILLQALHWFNPVVWFAFWRMREDREPACDALVLAHRQPDDRRSYGRALVAVLEHMARPDPRPVAVAIGEGRRQMTRRLTMIAKRSQPASGFSILGAVLLMGLGCAGLTGATEPEQADVAQTSPPATGAGQSATSPATDAELPPRAAAVGDAMARERDRRQQANESNRLTRQKLTRVIQIPDELEDTTFGSAIKFLATIGEIDFQENRKAYI